MANTPTMPSPSPVSPGRSAVVTILGCIFVLLGALLMPISGISLLMILAGSYGTATVDVVGFLTVVVAPPAAFVVGIGMLRRRPWAWYGALVLLVAVIVFQAGELATARTTTTTHTSPTGTRTTVMAAGANHHSLPMIAFSTLVIVILFLPSIRSEFGISPWATSRTHGHEDGRQLSPPGPTRAEPARRARGNWRVGHRGRDNVYYEERRFGRWRRIEIDGEMLTGRAHHAIYVPSPESWQEYPDWARHRRAEIIERIRSALPPPDYEYHEGVVRRPPAPPLPAPTTVTHATISAPTASERRAAFLAVALLVAFSAGIAWNIQSSIEQGTTVLWARHTRISASRESEPFTFWLAIAIQSALATGSGGFALWLIFARRASEPSR